MDNIDEIRSLFAQELSSRIREENLRVSDVASHCQISVDRLNNYLQGRSFPNPLILSSIADFIGFTVNDLLDYDEADEMTLVGYDPLDMFEDEEEFMTHIRNRMEQCMNDMRIDIAELSEKTGFNTRTIKSWLGMLKRQPSLIRTSDLLKICDALCCTPSDLLGY